VFAQSLFFVTRLGDSGPKLITRLANKLGEVSCRENETMLGHDVAGKYVFSSKASELIKWRSNMDWNS